MLFEFFLHKMTTSGRNLLMPIDVRGMKVLDREKFLRNVQVPIIKVREENLSKVIRYCKPFFLKLENLKPIQNHDDETFNKCLYLNPEKINKWEDIAETVRADLKQFDVNEQNFDTRNVQLRYENWSFDTIFKAVLPEGEDVISGYSQIGHIIHLNLRDHLIDYRQLIGQVLVDKITTCHTVVNKSNIIDNTYRNFSMEVIAGKEDFLVIVKENNCKFQFDFSKVYWNPRLGKEHERIINLLKPDDILFDVFCGVGPFSIPAAKRKCKVFANDLNPESFKWLNHNAKKNNVKYKMFSSYNLDGKDFILNVFKDYLIDLCKNSVVLNDSKIHITMNLPALAVEFMKYFRGLLDKEYLDKFNFDITVYLYCFAFGDESESVLSAKKMVSENVGCDMLPYIDDVFNVRKVSPTKEMKRVTLRLTKDVIFDLDTLKPIENLPSKTFTDESNKDDLDTLKNFEEPPSKKACTEKKIS